MSARSRFERLPTTVKLFLILTLAMLPFGIALTWLGARGIEQANAANQASARDRGELTANAIQSLLARNALALRVAANGILGQGPDPCGRARQALSIAPAVAQHFEIADENGKTICTVGRQVDSTKLPLVAPGAIAIRLASEDEAIAIRVGVVGGMATDVIPLDELRAEARAANTDIRSLVIRDRSNVIPLLGSETEPETLSYTRWPVGGEQMVVEVGTYQAPLTYSDRLILLLPLLMWFAAALISFLLVSRLLIRPLRALERAVAEYQPGETVLNLPTRVGPSAEIQQLGDSFRRAIIRIDESENEMGLALEGQRRLVREVHHRVKNNLQVVASLLNIHGRSAESDEAKAAYAAIARRVGALSVVHRNHFAEMEESRGIALRPLLSELAAELRASAPATARGLAIELDVDSVFTTQDAAVATAFLITEIVEFAMISCPSDPIEIALERTSELTARLRISSKVLDPEEDGRVEKVQFERIVSGLAKQLRSTLERKLGRYGVELPVFPQR